MFAIIQAAGWPIWPLLLASVIALALIIERFVSLRDRKIIPPLLLEQVVDVYQRQGVSEDAHRRVTAPAGRGDGALGQHQRLRGGLNVGRLAVEQDLSQRLDGLRIGRASCRERVY